LQKEFEKFGKISEARVVRDAQVKNNNWPESYRLRPTDQKDTALWRFLKRNPQKWQSAR
jgi:cysteinyl-tRNA synthetase